MFNTKPEIFYLVVLISVFFFLLIAIIIITALLYHSRKRLYQVEVAAFQNILIQTQLEVQEQTMQTIGADLHDNIGQLLSLTSLTLGAIELAGLPEEQAQINSAIELTGRSINELRLLGRLIQGTQLVDMGLTEAIAQEALRLERTGRYKVVYKRDGEGLSVDISDKDLIIFRVVQETINNIIKHAGASQITIVLSLESGVLFLSVADNGQGFDAEKLNEMQKGMGLSNMSKRVNLAGGRLEINSQTGEGTTVHIFIPYP